MAPPTAPGKSHVINWIKNGFRCPQRPTFPDTIWSERDIGLWVIFGRILNLPRKVDLALCPPLGQLSSSVEALCFPVPASSDAARSGGDPTGLVSFPLGVIAA